jgi:hypothetical protein
MSIVVRYAPVPSSTIEQYDEVTRRLQESGELPADGFDYHVAFHSDSWSGSSRPSQACRSGIRRSASSMREAYDDGRSTEEAVAHGIKTTAGVVSAAAFVMVAVFAIFLTVSTVDMKQFGFGLAVAILIDATIVRAVLLPATMKLLGDWNWYLPSWLQWLPRLEHERPAEPRLEPQPEILAA